MKRFGKYILIGICAMLFATAFIGCGSSSTDAEGEDASNGTSSGDAYEDYIHDALAAVRDDAQIETDTERTDEQANEDKKNGHVVEIVKDDSDEDSSSEPVFISSSEAETDTDTDDKKEDDEPKTTPATFEVGTGLVYIDGKYDETYGTNLLSTINDARTGLNYPAMTINDSLNTCAKLRAKEITCFLSHTRLDGSGFYSLAPDYYKAEIITIDSANPKETLDAWMTDPISRGILFSKDYTSIGAANYICNGLNCIVVSFGY